MLDWNAPAGCPTANEVQREVERLVGTSLPSGPRLWVSASFVEDAAHGWTLTLYTRDDNESGERMLSGKSCRAVADAAVLTLALTLNPELKVPESDASNSASTNPPPASSNPHEPITKRNPVREPARATLHGYARAMLGLRAGAAADLAGEAGLGLGVGYERIQNWMVATFSPETTVTSHIKSNAGARYWQGTLTDLVCYSLGGELVTVQPCVGLQDSWLEGGGQGFGQNTHTSISWFSAVAGAGLALKLHPSWHARIDGYGLLPLKRPYAYVTSNQIDVLVQPAPLGAQGHLGLEYRFW